MKKPTEQIVNEIRRASRRQFSVREDSHSPFGSARRGEYRRTVPP
jgi:hypothetical protein